jgi:hypothetical protein
VTILFNEPPPPQLIGGEKLKTKCVDDNPSVSRSIVDCGRRFFGLPDYIHIYEGCDVRIIDREGWQGSHYDDYIQKTFHT